MGCRWSRVQISPPRPENTFCGDLTALLLVQPFRQVDTHERGAGHKSASWSDLDATAWGMQFSTLNAYPSAVPVPKEIFADVLHAVPVAASITILVGNHVLLGLFKLLQHTVRIVLKSALNAARRELAKSHGLGVSDCAG